MKNVFRLRECRKARLLVDVGITIIFFSRIRPLLDYAAPIWDLSLLPMTSQSDLNRIWLDVQCLTTIYDTVRISCTHAGAHIVCLCYKVSQRRQCDVSKIRLLPKCGGLSFEILSFNTRGYGAIYML